MTGYQDILLWFMEPKQAKSKDGVIRRNLDRIRVPDATPLPSTHLGTAKWALLKKKKEHFQKKPKKFCLPDHVSDQVKI